MGLCVKSSREKLACGLIPLHSAVILYKCSASLRRVPGNQPGGLAVLSKEKEIDMKKFLLVAALLAAAVASGCAAHRHISEIKADPGRFTDHSAVIEGTVSRSYGVWKYGAYELEDSTGSIWVIASRSTPAKGSHVQVKGKARTAFNLPFINFTGTAFQEEERKTRGRF